MFVLGVKWKKDQRVFNKANLRKVTKIFAGWSSHSAKCKPYFSPKWLSHHLPACNVKDQSASSYFFLHVNPAFQASTKLLFLGPSRQKSLPNDMLQSSWPWWNSDHFKASKLHRNHQGHGQWVPRGGPWPPWPQQPSTNPLVYTPTHTPCILLLIHTPPHPHHPATHPFSEPVSHRVRLFICRALWKWQSMQSIKRKKDSCCPKL